MDVLHIRGRVKNPNRHIIISPFIDALAGNVNDDWRTIHTFHEISRVPNLATLLTIDEKLTFAPQLPSTSARSRKIHEGLRSVPSPTSLKNLWQI